MNPMFRQWMDKAAQLTRHGDLGAATRAIREALGGAAPARPQGAPAPATPTSPLDIVDVQARVVPDRGDPPVAPVPTVPEEGRFVAGHHAGAGLQCDYKLYIPPDAGDRPRPLVVMMHGCTQDPDDFAAGTRMNEAARAQGFYVLYPAQSQQMNAQRCWNWFKHSHQSRDRGEPALLSGLAREVMAQHAIDPRRVYVAGLSAGGAMAAILGDTHPELFAAVGVHSGLAAGSAADLPSALMAMKRGAAGAPRPPSGVPTIVFHGDADATVNARNGEQVAAASAGAATVTEMAQSGPAGVRPSTRRVLRAADGRVLAEHWIVHGSPHAWSGGSAAGSYTDPQGPDASAAMLRFFFEHPRADAG
jgi:poly(hydroxyalkanoate) depolymerase family esterase